MVRISFDVSENTRQELKVFAANRGQTIRSLMLWFVDNILSGKIDPSPLWLDSTPQSTDLTDLVTAARDAASEYQRLRDVLLPHYETKIGEPDLEILEALRKSLAPFKPVKS